MNRLLLSVFIIGLLIFSFAHVRAEDVTGLEGQIENASKTINNIEENISKIKYDYLSGQWKEVFLKNKTIASINSFFTDINIIFVILFGRSWSLSLEMLFSFMLWLFTLLSLTSYAYFRNGWYKTIFVIAVTILLAQLQIFNYIALIAVKLMFYRSSASWSLITAIFIFVAIFFYLIINKKIAASLKKTREEKRKLLQEEKTKELEAFNKSLRTAYKS